MLIQSLRQNKLEASIWTSNPISETKLEPFALQQRRTAVLFCQLLSLFVRALEKELDFVLKKREFQKHYFCQSVFY